MGGGEVGGGALVPSPDCVVTVFKAPLGGTPSLFFFRLCLSVAVVVVVVVFFMSAAVVVTAVVVVVYVCYCYC